MPFDATPDAEVTARDRMIRLRDFLARLAPSDFDMVSTGRERWESPECGSPACIGGWARILFHADAQKFIGLDDVGQQDLGLTYEQTQVLFFQWRGKADVPRAVAVIDHYLATGEIDWSVAAP